MMKKKWLAFLLSVCLLVATLPFTAMAAASDFEVEDGVLLKYNGNAASVTVPAGVFYIGDSAFEGNTSLKMCIRDRMTGGPPMNRLIQGDVGSGKTAVAAALCYCAAKNGWQAAFMAPTEILAEQHFQSLSGILKGTGVREIGRAHV